MKQRLWVIALAVVMFLSGLAASALWQGPEKGLTPSQEAYADRLEREFQLTPGRAEALKKLLRWYALDIQRIKDQHGATQDTSLGRELDAEAVRLGAVIRDKVLPPDQREKYDRMLTDKSQPFPSR